LAYQDEIVGMFAKHFQVCWRFHTSGTGEQHCNRRRGLGQAAKPRSLRDQRR
jgi:hypothetical protein